jgi:hypothetical protein
MYNYFYEKHDKIINSQKETIELYKHEIELYKKALDSFIHSSESQIREIDEYKILLEEQVKSVTQLKQKCKIMLDYIKMEKYKHATYEFSGKMIIDIKKLQSITKFNKLPLICEMCYTMENNENKDDFLSNVSCDVMDCKLTVPHNINHVLCKNCH